MDVPNREGAFHPPRRSRAKCHRRRLELLLPGERPICKRSPIDINAESPADETLARPSNNALRQWWSAIAALAPARLIRTTLTRLNLCSPLTKARSTF